MYEWTMYKARVYGMWCIQALKEIQAWYWSTQVNWPIVYTKGQSKTICILRNCTKEVTTQVYKGYMRIQMYKCNQAYQRSSKTS